MTAQSASLLAALVTAMMMTSGRTFAAGTDNDPRLVTGLNTGWKFKFDPRTWASPKKPDYDDSSWETVDLPHTFNADDGADGGGYRRGPGWYRLRFTAPDTPIHRYSYLYFDGAGTVTTVWLNGKKLGVHYSGTSAFCFDATEALRSGSENLLAVRADNTWRDDMPPREGDFTVCGGLYRGVSLITTHAISVDPLDYAGPGVYITTQKETGDRWRMRVGVKIRNNGREDRDVTLNLLVLDTQGRSLAGRSGADHRATRGSSGVPLQVLVDQPRLWDGRNDPHLYDVVVEVWADGKIQDKVITKMGFRTFVFDPERGFLLNGRPYDLVGANLHQDREGKGWALTHEDRVEDLKLLMDMGGTFVRLVHYQHDQDMVDLCDELGLVVWAEQGLVNTVSRSRAFSERALRQMTELIRQNYNHPSIVTWGIGNEVQTHQPSCAKPLMEHLAALVRSEDPTRPSVMATCFSEVPGTFGVDLVGHNQYFGWYRGTFEDFPKWLDEQRAKAPDRCQGMSEFGAGAGIHIHRDVPKAQDHSEEYQALFHEAYWLALKERPWVWCKAVWQMFDSASDGRNEGEKPGINDKGLVTRDRRVKKDAYFWYKANWNPEAMVYIASRRFSLRDRAPVDVKVYSNCDKVTLTLNGKTQGTKNVKERMARWGVQLGPGSNMIEVEGVRRGVRVKDSCSWFYEPMR